MRHLFGSLAFTILWLVAFYVFLTRIEPVGHAALHEGRIVTYDGVQRIGHVLTFPFSVVGPALHGWWFLVSFLGTAVLWGVGCYFVFRRAYVSWKRARI